MKKTKWIKITRMLALSAVVAAVIVGIGYQTNLGTLCSLCPLGFLQVSLAGKSIAWNMLWPVVLVLAAAFIVGKAFCAWICPTTWMKQIFKGKKMPKASAPAAPATGPDAQPAQCNAACGACGSAQNGKQPGRESGQYGYGILIGALAASFIVGFPVFCLICPIGIFFGFIYAVYRLSVLYTPGWELVIFPAIFIIEIFVLRSWCKSICPVGAIFRLLGRISPLRLQPKIKQDRCIDCGACVEACPENIDLLNGTQDEMQHCNLCLECYEECPKQSIQIGPGQNGKTPAGIPADSGKTA